MRTVKSLPRDRADEPAWVHRSGVHRIARLQAGDCIAGKYVIRRTLGAGGFAVVYEAMHVDLECAMAIKVMHLHGREAPELVARFHEEGRLCALAQHRHVLTVFDTGTLEDGSPYLVMERLNGEVLHERIHAGSLTYPQVLEVTRQLLSALCALSDRGILHRDIKPENLMLQVCDRGQPVVKLVDFGVSTLLDTVSGACRLVHDQTIVGTPQYMSPEHLLGEALDARSDLYSAGVVMYEALAGHLPHDGPDGSALIFEVLNGATPAIRATRPDCPPELERIVLRAIRRDRTQRYSSALDMLKDLDVFARSHGFAPAAVRPGRAIFRLRWLALCLLTLLPPEQASLPDLPIGAVER